MDKPENVGVMTPEEETEFKILDMQRAHQTDPAEFVTIDGEQYQLGPIMPGNIPPHHYGWYPRNYGNWRSVRDLWNGEQWMRGRPDGGVYGPAENQNLEWRGVIAKPNAQKIADAMFEDAQRLAAGRKVVGVVPLWQSDCVTVAGDGKYEGAFDPEGTFESDKLLFAVGVIVVCIVVGIMALAGAWFLGAL